ncbi:MAG: GAF domain-containing protein [Candidatus Omnitrophota bacterium]|jgi:signal transduction histidine kinase|nr:MAG: GAF domain-containing protein [Candidatus Omnitrophota bacterium]
MSFLGFTGAINFITCLAVSILIVIKNIKNPLNRSFFNLNLSVALYSFGYFFWQLAKEESQALLWFKVLFVGIILINITYLYFVFYFLGLIEEKRKLLRVLLLINIFFIILNLTSRLYTGLAPRYNLGFWPTPTFFFHLYLIFWFWQCLYGFYWLIVKLRESVDIKRTQIKYFTISAMLGFAGGATNWPMWYSIHLPPYFNIMISFYIGIVAYAVFRYRLVDPNVALSRIGVFISVYLLVLGIPFAITGFGKNVLISLFGNSWFWCPLIIFFILATVGPFIFIYLTSRVEARLLAEKRKRQDNLRELSSYMMRFTRIRTLLGLIVHNVLKILQLKHAAFYLLENDPLKGKQFNLVSYYAVPKIDGLPKNIPFDSVLADKLFTEKIAIEYGEIKHKIVSTTNHALVPLENELIKFKANIVIPILLRLELVGFLILGGSRNDETFTKEEINVLQVLSNQAALAIENASFWQGEEDRIVESSREQAVSDVSFGAGHQFNNRLYAISMTCDGIFDMLGERNVCDLSDAEAKQILQKSLPKLKKISDECQYGGEITKGIMSLTGTTPPNFEEFDPSSIINSSLELVEMKHSQDKIEGKRPPVDISCQIDKNLPSVFGSDAQIRDCVFNLVDNSFDAVYEKIDKIRVRNPELKWPENDSYAPHIELKAFVKDNYLIISITDNGIGIKEEDKRKIFAGYYSSKPTGLQGYGKGGHGVGLFVVKKFILAHKGKIDFASEYGQGTTFTIELPLLKTKESKNNA